jgi:hypothetical protein
MKNAAMVLGIIGGVVGMVVGFFGYGFAEIGSWFSETTNPAGPGSSACSRRSSVLREARCRRAGRCSGRS